MNYELANELKEAGFPQGTPKTASFPNLQNPLGYFIGEEDSDAIENRNLCYVPTLEELIEACENKFVSLKRTENDWNIWQAIGGDKGKSINMWYADTKEAAVARLWLALSKE